MNSILAGTWIFAGLIYGSVTMPPPNPALKIEFVFDENGLNTLKYHREGELGYCLRQARYSYIETQLTQDVIWVDPANAIWCGQDTDMQLGNHSVSTAVFANDQMHLTVPLSEEDLIFVWERIPE